MRDLIHFYDNNSVFVNQSQDLNDYLRDGIAYTWVAAEDSLYIGLYKPFNQLYLEVETSPLNGGSLSFSYYNGASFVALNVLDDTKDLDRSGFLSWEKPDDWKSTSINNEVKFWVKINYSVDDTFNLKGLNIVFSDDNDLKAEVRKIDRYLASGDSSFIAYHVASKNEIIQSIRNSGNVTTNINGVKHQFTPWDILKPDEIRQASKFLTLHKIFFDASDNVKDKSYQRSKDYHSEFGKAFKLFYKTFDKDDDGKVDNNERLALRTIRSLKI